MNTPDSKFEKATKELEQLALSYSVPKDTKGYEEVWVPGESIKMWSVPRRTAELLRKYVLEYKPKVILELGTSSGYSTIWLASGAKEYGGKIYTVEMARPKIEIARKYIKETEMEDVVEITEGKIADVLKNWEKPIDFVFLDADKMNYKPYIDQIEPHLNKGAIVIADNAIDFAHLMKDYLTYVQESGKYKSELLNIDNGLMVSVKL
ncbi:MAG: class I SAM-dependent methyltransferase [Candidatus Andersenbacteria bacterium]